MWTQTEQDYMLQNKKLLFGKDTIDFVTVAFEYCSLMERVSQIDGKELIDKCSKILPLLYLKTILLPIPFVEEIWDVEEIVTEETYDALRSKIATLMGEQDVYLVTFHQEMKYSDTPVAASISEDLADIYQDLANFLFIYRDGIEQNMKDALIKCKYTFETYWGMKLLNSLGALHSLREVYDLSQLKNDDIDQIDEEEPYEE